MTTPRIFISEDRSQVITGDGYYAIIERAPDALLSMPEGHKLVVDLEETRETFNLIHPLPGDTLGSVVRFTINIKQMLNVLRKMDMAAYPFAALEIRHMKYRGRENEQDCLVLFGGDQVGILSALPGDAIGHEFYNPFDGE